MLVVGLPRAGAARLREGQFYDFHRTLAAEGYWAVRVVRTLLTPHGSSQLYSDYIVRPEGRGWRFVKAINLLVSE